MHQSPFIDSIYALSTGVPPTGVAVIRMSGPATAGVLEGICGDVPAGRKMVLRCLRNKDGLVLDRGLVCFFPGPGSFTGEDSAEFHIHGGRAVINGTLAALESFEGLRHAEPGEFTRRAFMNGKIDLTGAEALSDLIHSETEAQRRLAQENASGSQYRLYGEWRDRLVRGRALIEAELDFSDEEDVPGSVSDEVWVDMRALAVELRQHMDGYKRAEIIRDGFRVAIIGAPNVGKSSLLNSLAKRDVAIVSDEPGTTRDVLTATLDLDGHAVIFSDTAGIREDAGKIEAMGIEKAYEVAGAADLVLLLFEGDKPLHSVIDVPSDRCIFVKTKSDIDGGAVDYPGAIAISAETGSGLDELLSLVSARAEKAAGDLSDILPSRSRHMAYLKQAADSLDTALKDDGCGLELRAESLRMAQNSLARITGAVDVEDLLDVVFGTFCIGK